MEPPSDADVIVRSLADPDEFAEIFDRHAATLLGYGIRRLGRADAEDVLAECFRIAFETRERFDPARVSALPWLYGIAANLIMKQHRGRARLRTAVERLRVVDDGRTDAPFDDAFVDHDTNVRLLGEVSRRIDGLPVADREVVLLYVWERLSYDDIAEALDLPVGTVRSRLNRVRRQMRELRDGSGEAVGVPSERAPEGV